MLVIHIALTPLAGAPIRIVNAINAHAVGYQARLIVLEKDTFSYGNRKYPEDLFFDKNYEESLKLISEADIVHFHHFFDVESDENPFAINFKEKTKVAAFFVRHFHTNLESIISWSGNDKTRELIENDPFPKLVVPHCGERYLLNAHIVPNIIPCNDILYQSLDDNGDDIPVVFFSSTSSHNPYKERWETKGKKEVLYVLKMLENQGLCKLRFVENKPYEECLELKRSSDIIIGDLFTGSYHLTELESVSMGKPTLCFIDGRTQLALTTLTGCDKIPFVNVGIENLVDVMIRLCGDKKLRQNISQYSRKWVEKYYNDRQMIQKYCDAYNNILKKVSLNNKSSEDLIAEDFLYREVYDIRWRLRKKIFSLHRKWPYKMFCKFFKFNQ